MSNKIFKPHRGRSSVMSNQKKNIVLEAGEMFIELPDSGTGNCKMKIGDGNSTYENLPYAMGDNSGGSSGTDSVRVIGQVTGDGIMTYGQALSSLYSQIQTDGGLDIEKYNYKLSYGQDIYTLVSYTSSRIVFTWMGINSVSDITPYVEQLIISDDPSYLRVKTNTGGNKTSQILDNGVSMKVICYNQYSSGGDNVKIIAEYEAAPNTTWDTALDNLSTQINEAGGLDIESNLKMYMYYDNGLVDIATFCRQNAYGGYVFFIGDTGYQNGTGYIQKFVVQPSPNVGYLVFNANGTSYYNQTNSVISSTNTVQFKIISISGSGGGASSEEIGDLEDLTTTDKTNIVNAINEVNKLTHGEEVILGEWNSGTYDDALTDIYNLCQNMTDDDIANSYISYLGYTFKNTSYVRGTNVDYVGTNCDPNYMGNTVIDRFTATSNSNEYITITIKSNGSITVYNVTSQNLLSTLKFCKRTSQSYSEPYEIASYTSGNSDTHETALNNLYSQIQAAGGLDLRYDWKLLYHYVSGGVTEDYIYDLTFIRNNEYEFGRAYIAYNSSNGTLVEKYLLSSSSKASHMNIKTSGVTYADDSSASASGVTYKVIRGGLTSTSSNSDSTAIASVIADGVKTFGALLDELYNAIPAGTNLTGKSYLKYTNGSVGDCDFYSCIWNTPNDITFTRNFLTASSIISEQFTLRTSGSKYYISSGTTVTDKSSTVVTSGHSIEIIL